MYFLYGLSVYLTDTVGINIRIFVDGIKSVLIVFLRRGNLTQSELFNFVLLLLQEKPTETILLMLDYPV